MFFLPRKHFCSAPLHVKALRLLAGKTCIPLAVAICAASSAHAAQSASNSSELQRAQPTQKGASYFTFHNGSYITVRRGEIAFAFIRGSADADFDGPYRAFLKHIRASVYGDFIYYRHLGNDYVLQDAAILSRATALYAPLQHIEQQQTELVQQQRVLGAQQKAIGLQRGAIAAPADISHEIGQVGDVLEEMKRLQSRQQNSPEALGKIQRELVQIQRGLGKSQEQTGMQAGAFGESQEALGLQQSRLGNAQSLLGNQEKEITENAQQELIPNVEQAIHEGKAKPAG